MKLLGALAAALALAAAPALAHTVGFQHLTIPNGADKPIDVGVWYPSDAPASPQPLGAFTQEVAANGAVAGERLPLVVMSHGTGGWFGEHVDTALALAGAGFVVAALSHTGDTYVDQSRAARISGRPAQLRRLIDYMLAEWSDHGRIDADRVGAFGFSAGGFTVLASVGGAPDLGRIIPHCQAHPSGFECGVMKQIKGPIVLPDPSVWARDARIKAAVVAAPALGYTFDLAAVTVPIQLWRAEDDHILPGPDYAEAVMKALPRAPEYHVVKGADHMDFLAPCTDALRKSAPEICDEIDGFDRAGFHADFDRDVVAFFQRELR
jgi:predicted dienelactone hydrolase